MTHFIFLLKVFFDLLNGYAIHGMYGKGEKICVVGNVYSNVVWYRVAVLREGLGNHKLFSWVARRIESSNQASRNFTPS
jgi:hypothetical protein